MTFDEAFHELLGHEGGYSNHPADPGGETMWGVTKRVAQAHGYTGDMKALPVSIAKDIYRAQYWDAVRAEELPVRMRYPVFDAAVNSGVVQAVKWLQTAVGAEPDGKFGPRTMLAVRQMPVETAVRRMLATRLEFMTDLKTWPTFSKGWARRIAALMRAV